MVTRGFYHSTQGNWLESSLGLHSESEAILDYIATQQVLISKQFNFSNVSSNGMIGHRK